MNCAMVVLNYRDCDRAEALALKCAGFSTIEKIVIVDNCSNDGSYEKLALIRHPKIEVLLSDKNGGFSYGNNIGAKYLVSRYDPEYILFANTDTVFPEENIIACQRALEEDLTLGVVSTRMYGPDKKEQNGYFSLPIFRSYLQDYFYIFRKIKSATKKHSVFFKTKVLKVDVVRGSFMFFRTNALKKAEYFDERTFLYCEESIMAMRLKKQGYFEAIITDKWYLHDHLPKDGKSTLISIRQLYDSRFFFMKEYYHIGKIKQWIMKICSAYSLFEYKIILAIKSLK